MCREHAVHRLFAPERVVARMLEDLAPEAGLLQPAAPAKLSGRSRLHEHVIVVEMARPPLCFGRARRLLIVDIRHILLPEGAVVKPVVALPSVHHRIHRDRNFQRRMRIDERHQRKESVVRDAEDPDLAVALRDVLHQPVNRVVGVGRVIDGRRIQRSVQRTVHHVVPLGSMLAPNVLHDADVPAVHDDVGGVVVAAEDWPKMRALRVARQHVGVVRRARQENGRPLRAPGHEDDRVQLDAVAHRDHHVALGVVEAFGRRAKGRRRLTWEGLARRRRGRRVLGLRRLHEHQRAGQRRQEGHRADSTRPCHRSPHFITRVTSSEIYACSALRPTPRRVCTTT